jgi:hypothetical protein
VRRSPFDGSPNPLVSWQTEALMYFLMVLPFNLIGNRFGRGFAEKHL